MPGLEWYIANGAAAQSALAAVLAGFVFASITVLISSPPKGDAPRTPVATPVYALFVTCLSLIIASYIFAAIGGFSHDYGPQDGARDVRPYVAGIFGSCIFSLGVAMMLFSIVLLLQAYGIADHLGDLALIFEGGIVVVFVSVASTIVPPSELILGLPVEKTRVVYAVVSPLIGVAIVIAARLTTRSAGGSDSGAAGREVTRCFLFIMLLTIPYALSTLYPADLRTQAAVPGGDRLALAVLIVVAVAGTGYFLYRWRTLFPAR